MTSDDKPRSVDIASLAQTLSRSFLDCLSDPAWIKDASHRYVAVNAAFRGLCEFQVGAEVEVIDVTDFHLLPLEMAEQALLEDQEVIAAQGARRGRLVVFNPAGEARQYETQRVALLDGAGGVAGTLGVAVDVTESAARQAQLRESERTLSTVVSKLPAVAYQRLPDADWTMHFVSDGCRELTGYEPGDFHGNGVRSWASIIVADDFVRAWPEVQNQLAQDNPDAGYSVEYRVTLPEGELRWVRERGVCIRNAEGEVTSLIGVILDFTETRHYLDEMVHRETHDTLTGAVNRPLLLDHLRHGIAYGKRYQRMVATLVVNIDHFKYVNQSLGHDAGDELLKGVALRLRGALREHDSVARLGADSFAMTLIDNDNLGGAARAMTRVLDAVRAPFMIGEQEIVVTCSVGCALYPNDGPDPETLLRRADTAMRHARNLGGDCYYFYSADSDRRTEERLHIEASLRRAIDNNELLVFYQPQVSVSDGRFIGMEALVRWHHPEMGVVSPGRFIPVAEESDLIVSIGSWILEQACRQTQALIEDGYLIGHVSVNLSPRQFRDPGLIDRVSEILKRTGLDPKHLELEITESLAMKDVDAVVAKLKQLKDLGLLMAIDDFGTGYSSLSYLRRFPIDRLKIDQSFVREVATSSDGAAIARAIIQLGHALDLRVIAEGVETPGQLQFLRENECDEIQGYYFSRPVDFVTLRQLLMTSEAPETTGGVLYIERRQQ